MRRRVMDNERARQIVESLGVIEVLYNGSPVWIENIKENNAEVSYIDTKNKAEVQVEKLIERKPSV
jgi:H-type small acid-soluble spore protein